MKKETKKIFVGVSGGVDSSVAVHLLKKQGYDVNGIFVKTWSPEWLPCTWVEEKRDAMRVCAKLDIPFHYLDAEEEYKKGVADYMIAEYRAGRTPNPDVLCNKIIKFGVMWQYAKDHGAEFIATGHYAQTDGINLIKGVDIAKDQSYFLWMITKDQLPFIKFPIGHLQKNEVRNIAKDAGLFTNTKKDSQGICFLGDVDMREFLSHYIEQKIGNVVNEKGEIVGSHDGVWFYTIGERHGFHINIKSVESKPYYVIGKDVDKNILIVSQNKNNSDQSVFKTVKLRETNWFGDFDKNKNYQAQIRYHGQLLSAQILNEHEVKIKSDENPSFGQSLVIYDGEILLGGGIIDALY